MKMKLDNQLLMEISDEDEPEGYKLVHEGKWVSEGKCEYQNIVFFDEKSGKHFMFSHNRSGSYFTDWCYSLQEDKCKTECFEVELKKVTTEKWVAVGDSPS